MKITFKRVYLTLLDFVDARYFVEKVFSPIFKSMQHFTVIFTGIYLFLAIYSQQTNLPMFTFLMLNGYVSVHLNYLIIEFTASKSLTLK